MPTDKMWELAERTSEKKDVELPPQDANFLEVRDWLNEHAYKIETEEPDNDKLARELKWLAEAMAVDAKKESTMDYANAAEIAELFERSEEFSVESLLREMEEPDVNMALEDYGHMMEMMGHDEELELELEM
jgi:tRNA A22 N-methylase